MYTRYLKSLASLVALTAVLYGALNTPALFAELKKQKAGAGEAAAATTDAAEVHRVVAASSEDIAATYNYRFGKDHPFTPGNAEFQGTGFMKPDDFPDAQYCGHCHQQAYHEWRQALHSNSFRTPFYRTSVNLLIHSKGIEFSRHCESCHNPVALLSGGITQESHIDRRFDREGVTCTVCHSIQQLRSTSGNGGYVMGLPSVMLDEKGNRIPGKVPYEQIMQHTDRHVRAVMKDFYRTPQFCAACHKANLPEHLNDFKFVSAFTAYDEWQNSKFSQQNPLTFYTSDFKTCQSCHMARGKATLPDYGAKQGMFASHSWAAGNTAVPYYMKLDEQMDKTVKFLQSGDYLNVDIFALKKASSDKLIAPLGSVPFHIESNEVLDAYVVIQNKNIGHSLIPEVRDLYQAWVEFTVKDATGKEVYHSGFLKPDGALDEEAHSFTNRPVDASSEFVDNHKVWTIHTVAFDNTVPAGRSTLVRYRFRVPDAMHGAFTITAKVNYQHFRQSYLNNVFGKKHPNYPVVELASRQVAINVGDNAPVPAQPGQNEDWMRWNNLGIAYLDQLQYANSVDAFEQVVHLRPEYADAYTNIAIAEIQWEKYGSAAMNVDKALALSPRNARALYYKAQVDRRAGHLDAEMQDLLEVVKQYPKSRDARRDLGSAYFRHGDDKDSTIQFEALQDIDPDDLVAHYNLSILYHRAGKTQDAEKQLALFKTEKINSEARANGNEFLRKHPENSRESVPWHVHTNLPETLGPVAQAQTGGR
ncbi:MAG: multiheme c-type cytochrome [Acidobacteriaceae bacterium]|nr:multiheme c-type cytochrome [Acidobacteriaceae bacterium]